MDTPREFLDAYQHPFYLGIDPGATGGLGFLSSCGQALVMDIPVSVVKRTGGTKTVPDYQGILALFDEIESVLYPASLLVCLEEGLVQVKGKGANAYTGFRTGCSYAMWPLFLLSRNYSLMEVHPRTWKGKMGLLKLEKEQIRRKAASLYPNAELGRKKDHNRAEALLLALYRKRLS